MEARRYKTAFALAKFAEVFGWIVVGIGFISGVAAMDKLGGTIGAGIIAIGAIGGLLLVFSSQLTLVLIDTENNTRQMLFEAQKTNAMLAETLGGIASNLNVLAEKGVQKK